jgi:hypothetical protein
MSHQAPTKTYNSRNKRKLHYSAKFIAIVIFSRQKKIQNKQNNFRNRRSTHQSNRKKIFAFFCPISFLQLPQ